MHALLFIVSLCLIFIISPSDYFLFTLVLLACCLCLAPLIMYNKHWYLLRIKEDHELEDKTILDSHLGTINVRQKEINFYLSRFSPLKFLSVLSSIIHITIFIILSIQFYQNEPDAQILLIILGIILLYLLSGIINLYYIFKITYPIIKQEAI